MLEKVAIPVLMELGDSEAAGIFLLQLQTDPQAANLAEDIATLKQIYDHLGDVHMALGALTTNMVNVALTVTRSNNRVILSWPAGLNGFILQANTCCSSGSSGWHAVTNSIVTFGNQNTTAIPLPNATQFYRLSWE